MVEIDPGRLEGLLEDEDSIPACPEVVSKVSELCADEKSTARDIGQAIMADEAISSKLIKLANSSFYGLSGRISTVTQAAIILGSNEIRSVVYSLPAMDLFSSSTVEGGIDLRALWEHSVRVAVLARQLAYSIRYDRPEEAFVGGVLHDMGQVILNRLLGADYSKLRDEARAAGQDLAAHELDKMGTSHAELGKRLVEKWSFPEVLSGAVEFHHSPERAAEGSGVAMLVFAANRLDVSGVYESPSAAEEKLPQDYREKLPGGADLVDLVAKAGEALSGIMQEFGFEG